jgi:hypothetical protein
VFEDLPAGWNRGMKLAANLGTTLALLVTVRQGKRGTAG